MFRLLSLVVLLSPLVALCQYGQDIEHDFIQSKKYVVSIGTVKIDTVTSGSKKVAIKRFVSFGSGLLTYVKYDSIIIQNVVTAKHVTSLFKTKKLNSIFIRPSWADTIKTTDYFGIEIPIVNSDGSPNVFEYPDIHIDLASILLLPVYFDKTYIEVDTRENTKVFPYNSMTVPYLGTQVWIWGYPGHIQSEMQNRFFYSIATFKPGYVAWKPPFSMRNPELNHITLVESNASFGNSGGPVFAIDSSYQLVGILVGGYEEYYNIFLGDKQLVEQTTNMPYIVKGRSGVSIIEKAEYVRKLVLFVQAEMLKYKRRKT